MCFSFKYFVLHKIFEPTCHTWLPFYPQVQRLFIPTFSKNTPTRPERSVFQSNSSSLRFQEFTLVGTLVLFGLDVGFSNHLAPLVIVTLNLLDGLRRREKFRVAPHLFVLFLEAFVLASLEQCL